MRTRVACLDVWDPAVVEVVRRVAPASLELVFARSYDDDEQLGLVADADVILAGWAAITAPMLDAAPRLRFIEKWGIGVDRIDVEAVRRKGIPLAITAGSNANAVAEHALMLILAVNRRVTQVDAAMRRGVWMKAQMRALCFQVRGKTVGLLGFGNIGRALARLLAGFGCRILYYDAVRAEGAMERELAATCVSLDALLADSDILSLHAPLTPQTRRVIDAAALARMKPGAILVNTARGELVDEAALVAALQSGRLRGAGLDAFDPEPPAADHPLLQLEQVVLTPHTGGGVFDNVENVARHAIGNILRFLAGEALTPQDVIVPVPVAAAPVAAVREAAP